MKRLPAIIGIILVILLSCKNIKHIDPSSIKSMWKDSDSLLEASKSIKTYFVDESIIKYEHKNPLDMAFVKVNLDKLDNELINSEQIYTYQFYILDTLKSVQKRSLIVILEQYEDKLIHSYKTVALKLIMVRNNSVLSVFTLAEDRCGNLTHTITSSILLPGNKIITRSVDKICSDNITNKNGNLQCWYTQSTKFFKYDYLTDKYSMYQNPINVTEN